MKTELADAKATLTSQHEAELNVVHDKQMRLEDELQEERGLSVKVSVTGSVFHC